MDWLDRMNGAIDYIEDNITGDIDYKMVAKTALTQINFKKGYLFSMMGI